MGTTLTGTTPQDTYDSLIKVTDNGPISGTAKYLSDGLGNDSVLALSTTALGIGTTSLSGKFHAQATNSGIFFDLTTAYTPIIKAAGAVSDLQIESVGSGGNLILGAGGATSIMTFFTNGNSSTGERMRITSAGNVGIGTTAPTLKLQVVISADDDGFGLKTSASNLGSWTKEGDSSKIALTAGASSRMLLSGNLNANSYFNSGGSVGIGTSSPAATLHLDASGGATIRLQRTSASANRFDVGTDGTNMEFNVRDTGNFTFSGTGSYVRLASATGGIQFNGDTAAANALDDYEEGTWTMGVSFGGASVGVTTSSNTGTYTKIGRQVTLNGFLILTSKGSSTGTAKITGLPFTIANGNQFYSAAALRLGSVSFANQFQGYGVPNTTTLEFEEITEAGAVTSITNADFANNSDVIVSLTYFV